MSVLSLVILVLVLYIIIMLHEYGHFLMARMYRLPAKIQFGFGKKIYQGKTHSIAVIPLGGFVSIGEKEYKALSPWKRIGINFGGPAANVVLAYLSLYACAFFYPSSFQFLMKHNYLVTPFLLAWVWFQSISSAFDQMIYSIFSHPSLADASGIIGVAGVIYHSPFNSLTEWLLFTSLLSINVGAFNLVPIPGLDGSMVLYNLIEWVFHKPVPQNILYRVNKTGIRALLSFFVLVSLLDIYRYWIH